jgi:ABC-2 type transport system ATP-binding protein
LILDEPAAALDPAGVQQVRELLRNARQAGKSIFFSSHQLTEVEHICDRIAFLNQGRMLRCGSLKEFQSESDRVEIEVRGLTLAEVSRIHSAATAGPASIRLTVPAHQQRRVIEAVWSAGGEIVSLAPLRRRLEELFLEWSADGAVQDPARDLAGERFSP